MVGFAQTEDKIYLVLEYCAGGDVAAYIKRHGINGRLSEDVARHFMRQLGRHSILGLYQNLLFLGCYG